MRKSILMLTAAATLMAGSALAQPAGGGMGGGAGRGGMTQEQRAMQFLNQKNMTPEQITAEREKMRAMSPEDRAKANAALDVQWSKLTAAQQAEALAAVPAGRGPGGAGRQGGAPAGQ